jgi:beta-barrel assembly-enhancing protease
MKKTKKQGAYQHARITNKNPQSLFLCYLLPVICYLLFSCASSSNSNTVELENKGTVMGVPTPEWVKLYLEKGVSALQAQSRYRDVYCIVGEESGVNRQFVISWADAASAQQRIGALLRTNIASRYEAAVTATSQSDAESSARYKQEINNAVNALVNVSYSGAQREADWWSLRRRYDPANKEQYTDEYTAYVLYTVPKTEMNRQIALALETSVSKDSALYDVTIALARDILLQGYDEKELQNADAIRKTAANYYDPPGSVTAAALDEISLEDEYLIGRDVAASILSKYRIWDGDPALTNYVNLICETIVINSPRPVAYNGYHAAILDSGEVNAFATPGGHILITRGLVEAAKSEDMLAAAIAHEIAHVQLSHGLRAIQTNRDLRDWFGKFSDLGAQTITDRLNAGFSRIQEFDADITAMSLLAAAGYDPRRMVDMLRELDKIQGGRSGGFNATHPSPASRMVNASVAANRYTNTEDNGRFREKRFKEAGGKQ